MGPNVLALSEQTAGDDAGQPGWGSHEETRREKLPPDFDDMPRAAKIDYVDLCYRRAELLGRIRGYIGSYRGSGRLSKEELAMVAIDLEVLE